MGRVKRLITLGFIKFHLPFALPFVRRDRSFCSLSEFIWRIDDPINTTVSSAKGLILESVLSLFGRLGSYTTHMERYIHSSLDPFSFQLKLINR